MPTSNANNAPDQDGAGDLMPHATTLAIGEECGCWGCEPIDIYLPWRTGCLA
jgi:hypothetical protein